MGEMLHTRPIALILIVTVSVFQACSPAARTSEPSVEPAIKPNSAPTVAPTAEPTVATSVKPTMAPKTVPTIDQTIATAAAPIIEPAFEPTLPLPWPLSIPTGAQIGAALDCEIESLASSRYPTSITADQLLDHASLETACDWAVLAAAYADRSESDPAALSAGQAAWATAVSQNSAYALTDVLFFGYLGARDSVAAPPWTKKPLTQLTIQYEWGGLGEPVRYQISITGAHVKPKVKGTVNGEPYAGTLPVETVQTLGLALTDLMPVRNSAALIVCTDHYPDWKIRLTYQGGREVVLNTYSSNVLGRGGPWWVQIDGQDYVQISNKILLALEPVREALELPVGSPMAMYCPGLRQSLLDITYPNERPIEGGGG